MHVRHIGPLLVVLGGLGGLLLPIGAIGSESGRLLTTLMGFFTAGVLPTISILIGAVSASGRSVKALDDAYRDTKAAIAALVGLLKLAGGTVGVLVLMSIEWPPVPIVLSPGGFPALVTSFLVPMTTGATGSAFDLIDFLRRFCQILTCAFAVLFVVRATLLPAVLFGALRSKHELAKDEARRRTEEWAPSSSDVKRAFSSAPEFAAVIRLEEKAP